MGYTDVVVADFAGGFRFLDCKGGFLDNIARVVSDGLCVGCGACVGVCAAEAIEMQIQGGLLLPKVEDAKCTRCRVCVRCCPGYSVDLTKSDFKNSPERSHDPSLGEFLSCYVCHSNNDEVRFDSSSGGTVREILAYALKKGLIDGAVVVKPGKDNPLEPKPFIARTEEDIASASGSKYCPVAADTVLKEILSKEGRFAVVGLPCHIHGVRKAEAVFERLKDRIVLHVGLFCGHTVSLTGTQLLLRKFGVSKEAVASISYRGNGWPGFMLIRLKDGRSVKIRFNRGWKVYWNIFSPFFFTPLRCMMCPDQFNELSDISVGDAWLPELTRRGLPESLLITRTTVGENLLRMMRNDLTLSVRAIGAGKAKESQAFALDFKKSQMSGRLSFFRALGKKTPYINPKPHSSSISAWATAFLAYASFLISSSKRLRSFLAYVPLPVFRLYFGLFKCFSLI